MESFFAYGYEQRALAGALLVGLSCGLLGPLLVLRNMALLGDALSHSVLPGIVVGFLIAGYSLPAFFIGAVIAGVVSALLITWLQRNARARPDASIGTVFSFMFALGIIGISWLTRQQGVHLDLKDFLFGNVLGVGPEDLQLMALLTGATTACVTIFYRQWAFSTFLPLVAQSAGLRTGVLHYALLLLLALVVVSALQSVGVILVIALLVTPASTALLIARRLPHVLAWSAGLGMLSAALGLWLALLGNLPPGPMMTVVAFGFYLLAVLLAPGKGMLSRRRGRATTKK
ncbi:MAG: metal ABC transporter permease [Bacteroidetes bacterium]|nr:metal ABC transporter permease [Bacteroidota bacterium]